MNEDLYKRTQDSLTSYVRSRLRDGQTPRSIRSELGNLITEAIYRELARGAEALAPEVSRAEG